MNDAPEVKRGEILAPEPGRMPDANRSMVASAFRRVRNQVVQRELAAFLAKARTWNEIVATLTDGERLRQEYFLVLERSKHLPLLRAAEEAKVLAEVQRIFDEEADREKERKLRNLRMDADIVRAQRDLDALTKHPAEETKESRGKRRASRIKEIREERDEMITAFTDGRTDDQLTEEERRIVSDIRLAAEDAIKRFLEEDRN